MSKKHNYTNANKADAIIAKAEAALLENVTFVTPVEEKVEVVVPENSATLSALEAEKKELLAKLAEIRGQEKAMKAASRAYVLTDTGWKYVPVTEELSALPRLRWNADTKAFEASNIPDSIRMFDVNATGRYSVTKFYNAFFKNAGYKPVVDVKAGIYNWVK